jgi:hypothetical protein
VLPWAVDTVAAVWKACTKTGRPGRRAFGAKVRWTLIGGPALHRESGAFCLDLREAGWPTCETAIFYKSKMIEAAPSLGGFRKGGDFNC